MLRKQFQRLIVLAVILVLAWSPTQVRANDRYYMLMFAAQTEPKEVRASHTFALFVRATEGNAIAETHSISWMPGNFDIRPLRLTPVAGANLSLAQTLRWAGLANARVTMWGPYPIRRELYEMAARQATRLDSRQAEYVVLDRRFRENGASNCIHAVSDLDTTQPPLATGTAFGIEATEMVLEHFRRYILPTTESARWLVERLRLNPAEIRVATPAAITAPARRG